MKKLLASLRRFFFEEKKGDSVVKTPGNQLHANAEITNKLKKLNREKKRTKQ